MAGGNRAGAHSPDTVTGVDGTQNSAVREVAGACTPQLRRRAWMNTPVVYVLLAAVCATAAAACAGRSGDTVEIRQFVSATRFEQQIPTGAGRDKLNDVIVPESIEEAWSELEPTLAWADPPVEQPDVAGRQVVLIKNTYDLEVTGYDISDTGLVVHGVQHVYQGACRVVAVVWPPFAVVAVADDPAVQPGMAIGDPVITQRVRDCD
jgi:hypothetical protein